MELAPTVTLFPMMAGVVSCTMCTVARVPRKTSSPIRTASPSARTTLSSPSEAFKPIVARPRTAHRGPAYRSVPANDGMMSLKGRTSDGDIARSTFVFGSGSAT